MKDDIYNNYNLIAEDIQSVSNNQYYFKIDDKCYYYIDCIFNEEQIKQKLIISNYVRERLNIDSLKIVLTNQNRIIDDKNRILLVGNVDNYNKKIDIDYIEKFDDLKVYNNNNNINDWSKKWSDVIDQAENDLTKKAIDDINTLLIINYFIGLGENAIYLFNKYFDRKKYFVPSHRTINSNYYFIINPLNYLWDYEQRDYAEYIKYTILNNCFSMEDIQYIFKVKKWNINDAGIFYSRVLFCNTFFEELRSFLNGDNVDIKKYLQIANIYESSIKDIEAFLFKNYNMVFPFYNN